MDITLSHKARIKDVPQNDHRTTVPFIAGGERQRTGANAAQRTTNGKLHFDALDLCHAAQAIADVLKKAVREFTHSKQPQTRDGSLIDLGGGTLELLCAQ